MELDGMNFYLDSSSKNDVIPPKKSEDEDTIEIAEVTEEEETQAKSALEENILNKGIVILEIYQ